MVAHTGLDFTRMSNGSFGHKLIHHRRRTSGIKQKLDKDA